ncbi:hypothetical protein G9A89_005951 [Geosiphon pyriformis]|nr:hypothetical protein G9A89_005951 [Geosiphon pyriformis]
MSFLPYHFFSRVQYNRSKSFPTRLSREVNNQLTNIKRSNLRDILFKKPNFFYSTVVVEQSFKEPIELRPYQKECIDLCLKKFLNDNIKRQIVSLPVGSGKTVIFTNLLKEIPSPSPEANKVLIIAHRQELLDQAHKHIVARLPDLLVEIDQGSRRAELIGDVIIASVQSLTNQSSPRLEKYDPSKFKAIIIDEAHHASAMTYRKILGHFGADKPETRIFVWGCSATIRRHDGVALGILFDEITYHRSFLDMIRENWLCNIKITTVKTNVDLSNLKSKSDFQVGELSRTVNIRERNELIVRTYLKCAGERKSTLVFAVDIDHVERLTEAFREHGVVTHGITGRTRKSVRSALLNEFKNGSFPVLVNCGILTEGTDIPNIDCILMSRPTQSSVLFQQMLGRGMRRAEGKENCLVIDFVDSYLKFNKIKTMPTLLGLEPSAELKEKDVAEFASQLEKEKKSQVQESTRKQIINNLEITEWENPFELLADCPEASFLEEMSPNAWVRVASEAYVLSLPEHTILRLEKEKDGMYRVIKKIGQPGQMGSFWRKISYCIPVTGDSLEHTLHACDSWVLENYGPEIKSLLSRNARWRFQPATPGQIKYLTDKAHTIEDWTNKEGIANLNRGQAANMITILLEGRPKPSLAKKKVETWKWEDEFLSAGPLGKTMEI